MTVQILWFWWHQIETTKNIIWDKLKEKLLTYLCLILDRTADHLEDSIHPPTIEVSWGLHREQFVQEQFEGSTVGR